MLKKMSLTAGYKRKLASHFNLSDWKFFKRPESLLNQ